MVRGESLVSKWKELWMHCKRRVVGVITGEITAKFPGEADCAVRGESLASEWKEVWMCCKMGVGGVNCLKLKPS